MQVCGLSIILFWFFPISLNAEETETPHLQFVLTYIQQLGAIEKIRDNAAKDLEEHSGLNSLPDCIRNMTKYQLEINLQIGTLNTMHLNKPFETLVEQITEFYEQKLAFYKEFTDACSALIAGPKPNIDYGKLAANMPKINANLEFIDQALFKISPLVFATLIDMREDSHGHVSHLIITKVERTKLIREIMLEFGDTLNRIIKTI